MPAAGQPHERPELTVDDDGVHVRQIDPPPRPAPEQRYRRDIRLFPSLRELWQSREMVRSVAERELRARYKQNYLGYAWAVITPFTLMLAFTLFFKRVADIDTGGAPYALFAYLALVPWGFFSTAVGQGGLSLIAAAPLLHKVYCPREVFTIGTVTVAMVDTAISIGMLAILFVVTGFVPQPEAALLPVLWAIQIAFTLGVVLVISSVVVYFRDLRAIVPPALQLMLFATPVAYSLDEIPSAVRPYYVIANPMGAVIDASRRTALLGLAPDWTQLGLAALSALVMLLGGYWIFKRLEGGIADVV